MDTDSVVWLKENANDNPIPTGQFLGDMCSELDPDTHITKFCSGGPKNYVYMTSKGQMKVTVKGEKTIYVYITKNNNLLCVAL